MDTAHGVAPSDASLHDQREALLAEAVGALQMYQNDVLHVLDWKPVMFPAGYNVDGARGTHYARCGSNIRDCINLCHGPCGRVVVLRDRAVARVSVGTDIGSVANEIAQWLADADNCTILCIEDWRKVGATWTARYRSFAMLPDNAGPASLC